MIFGSSCPKLDKWKWWNRLLERRLFEYQIRNMWFTQGMLFCFLAILNLIVCINAWIVWCPDVPKVKYDIGTIEVLKTKISKGYGILAELDWKYQVLLNLKIELSASRWLVTPNVILNLINWIEGVKWLDCVLSRCP